VTAEFFVLAFAAAINPKLLALDLLLIDSRRARAMFACILAGGLGLAIAIGIVDVVFVHADAVKSQGKISAGVDLAVGLVLLALGALPITRRLPRRRTTSVPETGEQPKKQQNADGWAQCALREPRLGLALAIGAEIWPEGTATRLRRAQVWLVGHAKQLVTWIALLLGAYLVISALIRLL
jgi:hypothetical protein